MADRIRRTDQPHQTKLRLEPHRTHQHPRSPNLVRTRRLRPQPRRDRRPHSMKPDHRATRRTRPTAPPRSGPRTATPRRPRLTMFQVEVASRRAAAQAAAKEFADELTPGVNLGLISYAGTPAVLVSLINDPAAT